MWKRLFDFICSFIGEEERGQVYTFHKNAICFVTSAPVNPFFPCKKQPKDSEGAHLDICQIKEKLLSYITMVLTTHYLGMIKKKS